MKKVLLLVLGLLLGVGAEARVLSAAQALARVQNARESSRGVHGKSLQRPRLLLTVAEPQESPERRAESGEGRATRGASASQQPAEAEPALYMFSDADGSFMVVSAESEAPALLGYGEQASSATADAEGSMALATRWWLEEYARQIAWLRQARAQSGEPRGESGEPRDKCEETREERGEPRGESLEDFAPVSPIMKTKWDQGSPYNLYTPVVNYSHTPTGCVATAMAQIMKVYEMPAKMNRKLSYMWNDTVLLSMPAATFDWANMADIYTHTTADTEASREAVATLMQACGYAVKMGYGPYGSGANGGDVPSAMRQYFSYSANMQSLNRNYYTERRWQEMIHTNLAAGAPVFYTGGNYRNEGHAFVCDGYAGDGFFHFNWGWSGGSDGYFLLSALDPSALGIGGGSGGGFSFNQGITVNIQPSRMVTLEKFTDVPTLVTMGPLKARMYNEETLQISGDPDGWTVINIGPSGMSASIGLHVVATQGADRFSTDIYGGEVNLDPAYGLHSNVFNLSQLPQGSYVAWMVFRQSSGQWKPLGTPINYSNKLQITVGSDGVEEAQIIPVLPPVITGLEFPRHVAYNNYLRATAMVSNPNEYNQWMGGIRVKVYHYADSTYHIAGELQYYPSFALEPGEAKPLVFNGPLQISNFTPDEYWLEAYDDRTGLPITPMQPVYIAVEPSTVACSEIAVEGDAENVNPRQFTLTSQVEAKAGEYAGELRYDFYPLGSGYPAATLSTTVNLSQGAAQSLRLVGDVDLKLAPATTYTVKGTYLRWGAESTSGTWSPMAMPSGRGYATVRFTTASEEAGIEDVHSDIAEELTLLYDPSTCQAKVITAEGSEVVAVTAYNATGQQVAATFADGILHLESAPRGLLIVTATNSRGNIATLKVMR